MPRDPLETALKELRLSLGQGRFDDLPGIAQRLEDAAVNMSVDEVKKAKDQVLQTAACIVSACEGVRAAQRRITMITESQGTYDGRGVRTPFCGLAREFRRF